MEVDYRARFDEVTAAKREYWRALGQFVDNFARTEVILKRFLIKLTGLDRAVGLVVTAGLRADTLATYILRVNDLTRRRGVDRALVKEAIGRFTAINKVRNEILHSGAVWNDNTLIVSNFLTARTQAHVRQFPIEAGPLEDMSSDLAKMIGHFILFSSVRPAKMRPKLEHLLERAWRSKPDELLNRKPKSPIVVPRSLRPPAT